MRILYFAHYARGQDAASAMDGDLFAALRAQGHEVDVLSPFRDPEAGRPGGSVSAGRLPRLVLSIPGYVRMLLRGLRATREPEVAIASQYHAFHPATGVAFLVARLRGRPLVARAHDPLPGSYRSRLDAAANRASFRIYRRILNHRHAWVLVPSPELREMAGPRLGLQSERVQVLPNNVSPVPVAEGAVQRLRQNLGLGDARVVLQFGSFTQGGTATLVEAIRRLGRSDVRVVILADANRSLSFAREAERRGVLAHFLFPGIQDRRSLAAYIALADVCVGILAADPTAAGSLPRSTLEAMAAGRPVVLGRDIVSAGLVSDRQNALLVPPSDSASLSDALSRLLDDAELARRLSAAAKETVASTYGSEAVARTFVAFLESVARPEALKGRADVAAA